MRALLGAITLMVVLSCVAEADLWYEPWIRGASSVAVNDDATALFVNPAGLGMYDEANSYWTVSMVGDRVSRVALAAKSGPFAVGYDRQYLWEICGPENQQYVRPSDSALDTYTLGLAVGGNRKWSVGFDYRWLKPQFGEAGRCTTWDAGIMFRPTRFVSVGASVRNISEPAFLGGETYPFGGKIDSDNRQTRMSYVAGIAVRPMGNRLTVMADAGVLRDQNLDDATYRGGLEAEIMDGIVLRGSIETFPDGNGRNDETSFGLWFNTTSMGAGADVRAVTSASKDMYSYAFAASRERMRTGIKPGGRVAEIEIAGRLNDIDHGWSLFGEPGRSAQGVIRQIRKAAEDSSIGVVLVRLRGVQSGYFGGPGGIAQEIRDELVRAREKHGKKLVAFLEYGASTNDYYLATAADRIVVSPASGIDGIGRFITVMRFTGTSEKLGIDWDYMTAGKYKSTFHSIGAGPLTDEQRTEVQSIVDDAYGVIVAAVSEGRGMTRERAEELCDGRLFTPPKALDAGLVDRIGYCQDAKAVAMELTGKDVPDDPEKIGVVDVSQWNEKEYDWSLGPKIAVIGAYGGIDVGEGGHDPVWGSESIGSRTLVEQLKRARKDESVKAVVLRVDSGGGSALASNIIWDETVKLSKEKPFIVSMADVAGSGGYYIACQAEKIFADPLTLTGSIGVAGMLPTLSRLFEMIGTTHETFKRGEHSDMWSVTRGMTDEELEMLRADIDWFYDDFLEKVASGRGLPIGHVREVAEGRVYTGTQALNAKLVDELGGLSEAIDYACAKIGIEREEASILFYREGQGWMDRILKQASMKLGLYKLFDLGDRGMDDLLQLRMMSHGVIKEAGLAAE